MGQRSYEELAIEENAKEKFGITLDVRQLIIDNAPISYTGQATVFLSSKKQLYVYITAQSNLLLGDVQKIIARMGLKAELFVPPKGRPTYFDDVAEQQFKKVFPGRTTVAESDLLYYRTLAPYNPALILIEEVKNGEIRQFDTDSSGGWRTAAKFAYRRIRTS